MVALLTKTLGVVCPTCDFLNVVGAVRCMSCGSATDAPATAQRRASTAEAPAAYDPPGLRRTPPPAPAPESVPSTPSGAHRQGPPRPTFQSSTSNPAVPAQPGPRYGLTVLAGPARGQRFKLTGNGAQVGRTRGTIVFAEDPFVSALHATISLKDSRLFIRDEGSTSGVFISISGTETVPRGGSFCTGLRLFRYLGAIEPQAPWNHADLLVYGAPLPNNQTHYAIEEVLLGDRPGRCIITPGPVLTIGQGKCEFSYPSDEGLAPRHCEVAPLATGAMLRDLSGGLGTYVKLGGERALKPGDRVRIGQQTLQVELLS